MTWWRRAVAVPLCLVSGLLWAQGAAGQRLGGGGGVDISIGRIILSLAMCAIIAVLAILLIRQKSGRNDLAALFARATTNARVLDIVEVRRMSPHADACVLRHAGREYLLILQPGKVRVLRDDAMPRDAAVAAGDAPCS